MPTYLMPDAGEGLTEAVIVEWHVAVGDRVRVNDDLLSVETAKSVVELPSPFAGTVTQILAAEGETVEVGAPVVVIDDGSEPADASPDDGPAASEPGGASQIEGSVEGSATEDPRRASRRGEDTAKHSGPEAAAPSGPASGTGTPVLVGYGATPGSVPPRARRRREHEVSRRTGPRPRRDDQHDADAVRRATARNVTASKDSKVHTTAFVEVDAGSVVDLVDTLRARRDFAGMHVTPLLIWCKAVCLAMRTNPIINASWPSEHDRITLHESVNIGFAADTPHGLLVPVIRDAQDRDLKDMATELGRLVKLAKSGRLQPADCSGGTFSITNLGGLGLDAGTPIISGNESAILAIGSIRRRPWVSERDGKEFIEPRWTASMSLSFDHRLIDGVEAARFLSDLAALITNPALAMMY